MVVGGDVVGWSSAGSVVVVGGDVVVVVGGVVVVVGGIVVVVGGDVVVVVGGVVVGRRRGRRASSWTWSCSCSCSWTWRWTWSGGGRGGHGRGDARRELRGVAVGVDGDRGERGLAGDGRDGRGEDSVPATSVATTVELTKVCPSPAPDGSQAELAYRSMAKAVFPALSRVPVTATVPDVSTAPTSTGAFWSWLGPVSVSPGSLGVIPSPPRSTPSCPLSCVRLPRIGSGPTRSGGHDRRRHRR